MIHEDIEGFAKLKLPGLTIDESKLHWVQYNPRKDIDRWGASITSLDGGVSGVPDLDSLLEFNRLNNTAHKETDFRTFSEQGKVFEFLAKDFDVGRSHFIRLGTGGFFPYHRDVSSDTFRLIYCISGCDENNFIWLQDRATLKLQNHTWYYINTRMAHATFSFFGSVFAVFNICNTEKSYKSLLSHLEIR